MKTTFREIKNCHPCKDGWSKLCNNMLGTDFPEEPDSLDECTLTEKQLDIEVSILEILASNGVEEAYWALRTQEYRDYCLILADVAESVLHIWEEKHDDNRPRKAIEAIRKWHAGETTDSELEIAAYTARTAYTASTVYTASAADAADAACTTTFVANTAAAAAAAAAVAVAYASADYVSYHKQQWKKHEQILRKHIERG